MARLLASVVQTSLSGVTVNWRLLFMGWRATHFHDVVKAAVVDASAPEARVQHHVTSHPSKWGRQEACEVAQWLGLTNAQQESFEDLFGVDECATP